MEYRVLGNTGLRISRLGFGGIPIQKTTKEAVRELMHALADAGVNYIDTARAYTVSEEFIGYGIQGIRDRFVLATKSMSRSADGMAQDIRTSLQKLGTDYIDLYQIHNPSAAELERICGPEGALEALLEAKAQGIIGHIGITLHSVDLFRQALELDWVETIMFPYNIVETQGEDLIARCQEKNIGFICMKPLAGGAIEDANLALRFIAANEGVDVVIPGMCDEKELRQNLAAVCAGTPLSPCELAQMQTIRQELGTHFCRRCNYCAPCTVGIPISAVFLMDGYLSRYGLEDWARKRYNGLAKPASACVGCGLCESRCPYQLPIRQMLKSAAQKFGK